MLSPDTLGSFAYSFNIFASKSAMSPSHLSDSPYVVLFLFIGAGLSLLASLLLIRAIDLRFFEPAHGDGEADLIPHPQEERENSLTLPGLLCLSAPRTLLGDVSCFLFFGYVIVATMRLTIYWGVQLYDNFTQDWGIVNLWVLLGLYLVGVLLAAFLNLRQLAWLQLLCVFLNLTQLLCRTFSKETHAESAANKWPVLLLFPAFVQLFANQLMIPSVIAALRVPSVVQSSVQAAAVGTAVVLYVLLGVVVMVADQPTFLYAEAIINWVSIPCLYANIHVRLCVLVEMIVAWRYGLNLKVAKHTYPIRVKAVQILLPVLIYLPFGIATLLGGTNITKLTTVPHGYMLCASLVLLAIAYSYERTIESTGRNWLQRESQWRKYVLYVGGAACLVVTVMCYCQYNTSEALQSLLLDAVLLVSMLLWQLVGNSLP